MLRSHSGMQQNPLISVVMPVYNAEAHLKEAIDSILSQTYSDFEFLILDDGSTDRTAEIVGGYQDDRIQFVKAPKNMGIVETLNRGIEMAQGKYIARMDADDIARSNRLERQVGFMESNSTVGVCGTWFKTFGAAERVHRHPENHDDIRFHLLATGCVLGHPTVMIRKSVLDENAKYYEKDFEFAEDYRLWANLSDRCELHNIPEVLLDYRTHDSQISRIKTEDQRNKTNRIRASLLLKPLQEIQKDDEQVALLIVGGTPLSAPEIRAATQLMIKLLEQNRITRYYEPRKYSRLLRDYWDDIFFRSPNKKFFLNEFFVNPVASTSPRNLKRVIDFEVDQIKQRARKVLNSTFLVPREGIVEVHVFGGLVEQLNSLGLAYWLSKETKAHVVINSDWYRYYSNYEFYLKPLAERFLTLKSYTVKKNSLSPKELKKLVTGWRFRRRWDSIAVSPSLSQTASLEEFDFAGEIHSFSAFNSSVGEAPFGQVEVAMELKKHLGIDLAQGLPPRSAASRPEACVLVPAMDYIKKSDVQASGKESVLSLRRQRLLNFIEAARREFGNAPSKQVSVYVEQDALSQIKDSLGDFTVKAFESVDLSLLKELDAHAQVVLPRGRLAHWVTAVLEDESKSIEVSYVEV